MGDRSVALLLALGGAWALSGCGKFTKHKECNELAAVVNVFIAETEKAVPVEYADPAKAARESRELAARYKKLDTELGALKITSEELSPRFERYKKLAEEAATALEGAARALESKDLELARRYRLDFDRSAKSEGPLVREINQICAR